MASADEIERRVDEFDSARSARRSATARLIGELAQRRAVIAEQLVDIEHELGEVLANAADAIDIEELARFTDVPAADLTRWLTNQKTKRAKRKRSADSSPALRSATSRGPSTASTPKSNEASPAGPAASPAGSVALAATSVS